MRIRWHGHACFEVAGSTIIVTDPHDGKSIGIRPPRAKADIILISHDHFDHNYKNAVAGEDSAIVSEPVMTVDRGVRIEGVEAFHDCQKGAKRGKVVIFRFELDGFSFCHLGDLGHVLDEATVERLAGVDFLFVPVGDVFTVGPEDALRVVEMIRPRVAVPMHYRTQGLSLSIRPLQDFLRLVGKSIVMKVGNEVDFGREDLPEKDTEYWVFSQ